MSAPSKNIYWRNIPLTAPVYDRGAYYVAGDGADAAVVNWEGREAGEAQRALSRRARLTSAASKRRECPNCTDGRNPEDGTRICLTCHGARFLRS